MNSIEADLAMAELPPQFPKERIYHGLQVFVILAVIGFAVLFYATATRKTLEALGHLDVQIILLAVVLKAVDVGLGAWPPSCCGRCSKQRSDLPCYAVLFRGGNACVNSRVG